MLQVKLNIAKLRDVEIAGNTKARFLGYSCLKPEQRLTLKESVKLCAVLSGCITKRTWKGTMLYSIVHDKVSKAKHLIIVITAIMPITYKHHHFVLKTSHAKLRYFNK